MLRLRLLTWCSLVLLPGVTVAAEPPGPTMADPNATSAASRARSLLSPFSRPPAPPLPFDPDRKAQIARRDELYASAGQLSEAGDLTAAVAAYREVLAMERELFGPVDFELTGTLENLATWSMTIGQLDEARDFATQYLKLSQALYDDGNWRIVSAQWHADWIDRMAAAEPPVRQELRTLEASFRKAMKEERHADALSAAQAHRELEQKVLPGDHPYRANTLEAITEACLALQDFVAAETSAREALSIRRASLGDAHRLVARGARRVAEACAGQLKFDEALTFYELSRAQYLAIDWPSDAAWIDKRIGDVLGKQRDIPRAVAAYERSQQQFDKSREPDGLAVASFECGKLLLQAGRTAEAVPYFDRAARARDAEGNVDSAGWMYAWHGNAQLKQGHAAEAVIAFEFSLDRFVSIEHREGLDAVLELVLPACQKLADELEQSDQWEAARSWRSSAVRYSTAGYGPDHGATRDAMESLRLAEQVATLSSAEQQAYRLPIQLQHQADQLIASGELAAAIPVLEERLKVLQSLPEGAPYWRLLTLEQLARVSADSGRLVDAQSRYEQAVALAGLVYGDMAHPRTATLLKSQAIVAQDLGDLVTSESLLGKALAMRRVLFGDTSREVADTLNSVALVRRRQGNVLEAVADFRQVLNIHRATVGEAHPNYAIALGNLALVLTDMGDHQQAEPLYQQSLRLLERTRGVRDALYSWGMSNLASHYMAIEEYALAEPLYQQALEILAEVRGKQTQDYAVVLALQANFYSTVHNYARTVALREEVRDIYRVTLGTEHPRYADSLHGLGNAYIGVGEYAVAGPLLRESLEILTRSSARPTDSIASVQRSLARFYADQKDFDSARALMEESQQSFRSIYGERQPERAAILSQMGGIYSEMGLYDEGEALLTEALTLGRDIWGEAGYGLAPLLRRRAWLHEAQGEGDEAAQCYLEALEIVSKHNAQVATALTEQQQLEAKQVEEYYLNLYLSSIVRQGGDPTAAFSGVVRWKGASLARQRAIRQFADTPELATLFHELQDTTRQWATLVQAPPRQVQAEQWKEQVDRLATRKDRLETQLARATAHQDVKTAVTAQDVLATLPDQTVLVDYIEYRQWGGRDLTRQTGLGMCVLPGQGGVRVSQIIPGGALEQEGTIQLDDEIVAIQEAGQDWRTLHPQDSVDLLSLSLGPIGSTVRLRIRRAGQEQPLEVAITRPEKKDHRTFELRSVRSLLAFVVRPDAETPIQLVDLGPVRELRADVDAWRSSYGTTASSQHAAHRLRDRVWQPLVEAIGQPRTILVSTDGVLSQIPLAALPGRAEGSYLIEEHRLAVLPMPQLLPELVSAHGRRELKRELLLLGDVDYDGRGRDDGQPETPSEPERKLRPWERQRSLRSEAGNIDWHRLPGAAAEIDVIGGLYRRLFDPGEQAVSELRASGATEAEFRRLAPQSYQLHLATHGFFGLDGTSAGDAGRAAAGISDTSATTDPPAEMSSRSGLVFAGANTPPVLPEDLAAWDQVPDDGYLTAEEIAALPLAGVDLVTLSACETGLGELAGGEGMLGIQRAFQVSGARSVIASLWKVDDLATRRVMEEFYRNYWERGLGKLDALREAQLWALNHADLIPRGARPPEDDGTLPRTPPVYWAAFILSGDWR